MINEPGIPANFPRSNYPEQNTSLRICKARKLKKPKNLDYVSISRISIFVITMRLC